MNRVYLIALFLSFNILATTSFAAELKVGVVNAAVVLDKSPQKASALARLEKEFSKRSKALETKFKRFQTKQKALEKNRVTLTAEQSKAKERALISEQRDLKRLKDEYNEDLSIRRNEELRKLEKKIADTIVALAKKESYDLILVQGVIYASKKTDLTDKVLAQLKASK